MSTQSFRAMGTDVEFTLAEESDLSPDEIRQVNEYVVKTVELLEAKFSRFRETSELSQANAMSGQWISISDELACVLELAKEAHQITGGLFNPCLGQTMEAIGYRSTFEKITLSDSLPPQVDLSTHRGSSRPPQPIVLVTGQDRLPYELSPDRHQVYLTPGYKIDLGGIAKGWIVEETAAELRREGIQDFILNAGGDMVCGGTNLGKPWRVGIEHPKHLGEALLTLDVTGSSVATSGTYRRQWQLGDKRMHHILDPRTNAPAQTDIVSCTVITQHLVAAEVYAKTCLLLGSEAGITWLRDKPHRGWVVVKEDGEVLNSWSL